MILTNGARDALATALNTAFASGEALLLETAYPTADRTAAIPATDVLGRFALGATPFSVSAGVLTLSGIPIQDLTADNAGSVNSLVLLSSGDNGAGVAGANARIYFSAGLTGATVDLSGVGGSATAAVEVEIDDATIDAGQDLSLNSFTITIPIGDALT